MGRSKKRSSSRTAESLTDKLFTSFSRLVEEEIGNIQQRRSEAPVDDGGAGGAGGQSSSQSKDIQLLTLKLELQQKEIEMLKKDAELRAMQDALAESRNPANQTFSRTGPQVTFSFRDIEESLSKFSGKDSYSLEKWIADIEDASVIYEWSSLQTVTFGKRLLTEDARAWLRTTRVMSDWEELKAALRIEFKPMDNSALIHKRMSERKKKPDEDFTTYLISMRELGANGDLEDVAIIQYVIEGIQDVEYNKSILYGAEDMVCFKKKLRCYEEIKKKSSSSSRLPSRSDGNRTTRSSNNGSTPPIRCFGCGANGHLSKSCHNEGKGLMCYNCKQFGHLAANCPRRKAESRGVAAVVTEEEDDEAEEETFEVAAMVARKPCMKSMKEILINETVVWAMIDSGSDLNFVASRRLASLGSPTVNDVPTVFHGVGSGDLTTMGYVDLKFIVDGEEYRGRFHLVRDGLLPCDLILGKEFLSQTVTTFTPESITVRRFNPELAAITVDKDETSIDLSHISDQGIAEEIKRLIINYCPQQSNINEVVVREQIDEWLKDGIVRPSASEYASPVVLANKKEAECENGVSADAERCWVTEDPWGEYGLRGCWIWRPSHKEDEIMARVAGQKFLPRFRDPSIIHLGQM